MLGMRAGAGIEIEAGIEGRDLVGTAGLDDPVAAADGPGAPADAVARFQHGDSVSGALKLISGNEARDARAEDDDRTAAAASAREARNSRRPAGVGTARPSVSIAM